MSGWSYSDWKGVFYPPDLPTTQWLGFYAENYNTAEINSSFYHLPKVKTVEAWVAQMPAGFKVCTKMSQYLTHILKLREPAEPLERFFTAFAPAKKHMGPVLVQLPPSVPYSEATVCPFLELLRDKYSAYEFALEARHASWAEQAALKTLSKFDIAWVISQSGAGFPYLEEVTSANIYIRFHGPGKLYASAYTDDQLQEFADKLLSWSKEGYGIWAYFNNTMNAIALSNADTLKTMMGIKG